MTTKESKAVAWQWEYFVKHSFGGGYWVTDCDNEYPQVLHQSDLKDRSKYRNITPLVPESALHAAESLLAEAEREVARLTSCLSQANILIEQFERDWYMACDERDRNAAQRDALQSRLDAVGRLTTELVALAKHHEIKADRPGTRSSDCQWHAGYDEGVSECVGRIRQLLTSDGGADGDRA